MADILRMEHITKQFGGMKANDDVSLTVQEGEILALLGENGAGKSTLMNILYGLYKPTSGKIYFGGKEVHIDSPLTAIDLGIGMVHQHFMLIPAFKTWENVVLGLEDADQKNRLHEKAAKARIMEIANDFNLQIDPDARIAELSVGLQQQVEILKVLYRGSKLLILDEPTGVLTPVEKVKLFETLRGLTQKGFSVIFISHKLDEVMEISDRVTVLCRGKIVDTVSTKDMTKEKLARLMVGRDVVFQVEKTQGKTAGKPVLELKDIKVKGKRLASTIKHMDLTVHAGEIVGVAGVDGNGQSELVEAVTGLRKVKAGKVYVDGKDMTNATPRELIRAKTALVPEDRKKVGTVKSYDIDRNLILRDVDNPQYCKHGIIDYKSLEKEADSVIQEYDIRLSNRHAPVGLLSGGNMQKVILAREIKSKPKLLLAMHPTRGLDVGAIEFIHKKLIEARDAGAGILLVSAELEEILSLSDRVVVMSGGKIVGELTQENMNMQNIGMLMGGEKLQAKEAGQ